MQVLSGQKILERLAANNYPIERLGLILEGRAQPTQAWIEWAEVVTRPRNGMLRNSSIAASARVANALIRQPFSLLGEIVLERARPGLCPSDVKDEFLFLFHVASCFAAYRSVLVRQRCAKYGASLCQRMVEQRNLFRTRSVRISCVGAQRHPSRSRHRLPTGSSGGIGLDVQESVRYPPPIWRDQSGFPTRMSVVQPDLPTAKVAHYSRSRLRANGGLVYH